MLGSTSIPAGLEFHRIMAIICGQQMPDAGSRFRVGDHIIYAKAKASPHPGQRADQIRPSQYGEDYTYLVHKYWVVSAVLDDSIEVMTRTGKLRYLRPDDPN